LFLATVTTLIVAGCSLHSIGVGVSNSSGEGFYVRLHYDSGEIHVLKAPAHKDVDVLWFGGSASCRPALSCFAGLLRRRLWRNASAA